MDRKVYVDLTVRVIMNIEEGVAVDNIVNELDVNVGYNMDERAMVLDSSVEDFQVIDSK